MVTNDELQFPWPWIYETRPLRLQNNITTVLDKKSVWLAAECGASRLTFLHDHGVDFFEQRQIIGMIELHNWFTDDILRQVPKCTNRRSINMGQNTTSCMSGGKFGAGFAKNLIGLYRGVRDSFSTIDSRTLLLK